MPFITDDQQALLQNSLDQAEQVLVVIPGASKLATVAGALALATSLELPDQRRVIIATEKVTSLGIELPQLETIKTELSGDNLQLSFPYDPDQVDKVSYHIDEEEQQFYLTIKPRRGFQPLDFNQVNHWYIGNEFDVIIALVTSSFTNLGTLYDNPKLFEEATTVVVNDYQPTHGDLKLTTGSVALGEYLYDLLQKLKITVSEPVATNLLVSIESATNGFQHPQLTTAQTFQAVAELLQLGGQRLALPTQTAADRYKSGDVTSLAEVLKKKQLEQPVEPEVVAVDQLSKPKVVAKKTGKAKSGSLQHQPGEGGVSGK